MELAVFPPLSLRASDEVSADGRRWRRALAISAALHALVLGALLQQHIAPLAARLMPPLAVELRPAPAAPPPPAAIEEPARQRAAAVDSRRVAPSEILAVPAEAAPAAAASAPVAAVAAPQAAAPLEERPAAPARPVAEAAPPRSLDPNAQAEYTRLAGEALEPYKRYPLVAKVRHWQGTALLRVVIGADGQVKEYHVARSSGFAALDQRALEMLEAALPLPKVPATLAGLDLPIDIPVFFRLTN